MWECEPVSVFCLSPLVSLSQSASLFTPHPSRPVQVHPHPQPTPTPPAHNLSPRAGPFQQRRRSSARQVRTRAFIQILRLLTVTVKFAHLSSSLCWKGFFLLLVSSEQIISGGPRPWAPASHGPLSWRHAELRGCRAGRRRRRPLRGGDRAANCALSCEGMLMIEID